MKKVALFLMVGLLLLSACKSDDDDNDTGLLAYCTILNGLSIVDVTDPERPIQATFLDLGDSGTGLALSGRYVYYLCYNQALLKVIDIEDYENPVLVGSCDLPEPGVEIVVSESGYYAYVACNNLGLQVIDVSVPAAPSIVGSEITGGYANGILVDGDLVYLADADSGLYIIDVSEPHSPEVLSSCLRGSLVNSVTKHDDLIWLSTTSFNMDCYGGIHSVDVSDPSAPEVLDYEQYPICVDVFHCDGSLYLISWGTTLETKGIYILSATEELYHYAEYRGWGLSAYQIVVRNDIAYIATTNGLTILNVSNPEAIAELSTIALNNGARDVVLGRR